MSFHFPQVFPLISDRSVWHNGSALKDSMFLLFVLLSSQRVQNHSTETLQALLPNNDNDNTCSGRRTKQTNSTQKIHVNVLFCRLRRRPQYARKNWKCSFISTVRPTVHTNSELFWNVSHRIKSLQTYMQRSLWRQTGNRPMPLTSSVVEQITAGFRNFYNLKKVKI